MKARYVTRDEQLAAQQSLREFVKGAQEYAAPSPSISKQAIAELGRSNWPHTYAKTTSDEVARDRWAQHVESFRFSDPSRYFVLSQQTLLSDAVILTLGSARWFGEGMPVYRLGHKQAASLMASSVSDEMSEHVKPPSRAFFIELPEQLIQISGLNGELHPATGVIVHVTTVTEDGDAEPGRLPPGEYWRWLCISRSQLMLWEMNRRVEEMIAGTTIPEDAYYGIGYQLDDHDQRVRRLITRLIVSMCLDLASGKELKRKAEPWSRSGKKTKSGPSFSVFIDPSEVEFDARPYIRAFLTGDRKSPDYRHTVEGHWKNQAYGPRHSLRKPIRILPYQRYEHLPSAPSP